LKNNIKKWQLAKYIYLMNTENTGEEVLQQSLDENGNSVSPIIASGKKNFLIDIDGTITEDIPNEEPHRMNHCEPYPDALEKINQW
jgi:hypothetical protein